MGTGPNALLLVDVQNDSCEGGSLAVPGSDDIFPAINGWIDKAQSSGWPILASRDWHPVDHISFSDRGGPWPVHCVQDTPGAEFHRNMALPDSAIRVSKGTAFDTDAYSAFDATQLDSYLRRHGIHRLFVAGLALDVCVQATVRDALKLGFEVELITDGTRAVQADNAPAVFKQLEEEGAELC